jgi:hypothetical protein
MNKDPPSAISRLIDTQRRNDAGFDALIFVSYETEI